MMKGGFYSGSKSQGGGFGVTRVNFWHDGSAKNQWLQIDNHHTNKSGPSTEVKTEPYVLPFDGKVVATGFMNEKVDAKTDIEIYKNGLLADTIQVRSKKWQTNSDFTHIVLNAGDRLSIFLKEFVGPGSDPADALVDVYIAFTSNAAQEVSGITA